VFGDVMEHTYPWPATFTADSFVELLMTQSDHRLLREDKRSELLDAVRELITRHGGEVVIPHATLLVVAHLRQDQASAPAQPSNNGINSNSLTSA